MIKFCPVRYGIHRENMIYCLYRKTMLREGKILYLVEKILYYCHNHCKQSRALGPEMIHYWDLTFVMKGTLMYRCNNRQIILRQNDAMLLPQGTLRERDAVNEPVDYVSINYTYLPGVNVSLPVYMPDIITQNIKQLIHIYAHPRDFSEYYARERIACLTNYILYELMNQHQRDSKNTHVAIMLRTIHERINEPLSLVYLAKTAHISKEYASQIFKQETGTTVTEYINERKMLLAREMIAERKLPVTEVAESLGFMNYSYFSRLFKKRFGVSPTGILRMSDVVSNHDNVIKDYFHVDKQ